MIVYSIVFLTFLHLITSITLPCASNCDTCSSSTQCTTCASQYYSTTINGTLQCLSCGPFCLNCTSSTNCTLCISPYVIQSDGSCLQCQISNAAKCKSIVSASQCMSGYYVSDNYCYSCLLNCVDCSSNADCRSCSSGYYLNSSVLTCNFCPINCLSCDPYNSTRCLSCKDGYSLSFSYTCDIITCSITNCTFCLTSSVCKQCNYGYYWSSSQIACVLGSSILCTNGAQGPYPNQCNRNCPQFAYIAKQNSTALWCLPYHNISINSSNYYQYYLYAYNNLNEFKIISSTSKSLTQQSNGQYSYLFQQNSELTLQNLPPYYKIFIFIKYRAASSISLALISTTETTTQRQNSSLPASTTASIATINTVYLHSNNLKIKFMGNLYIVELLVRTKNCPSYCFRCLNQDLCEMCNAPQYVSSYKCVDNCTIYYHLVTNRTCLTSCPDSFYAQTLGTNQKFCQPCVAPCSKCMSQILCLSCINGKYLYNYTCITNCPDTFYEDSLGICAPCISPCLLCVNQTTCISCKSGYWNSIQNVCTVQCPNGYYGNDNTKTCQICQSPCLTCRNTSTKCLTCVAGLYYHQYQCLVQCPQRFYPITSNLTCKACILPCFTCSTNISCLSCAYNYLYNSQCVTSCPDGYFQNLGSKSCSTCSSQCRTCQMLGQCTNCVIGKCFLEGSCVSLCPTGKYYTLITNQSTIYEQCQCLQCPSPCKQCLPSSQCLSCLQGFYLQTTHQCLNTCPTGYFSNTSTFQCTLCPVKYTINCIQCNLTACTRCTTSYLLHNGQCLSQCPPQHYKSSETCQKCVAPCLNCSSFSQCISCISPYLYSNGSCIIQCPFGRVSYLNTTTNNLICIACQLPCITCQNGSPTNCTLCQYTYFLYSPNNTCVTQCSSIATINTFYNELVTSTCSKCMFPCQTCLSQTQCLTCQIGFLTSNGKCQNCPYGTYANISTGSCIACPVSCSNCFSSDYCTGCNQGYYLYGHNCIQNVSICQINGYYPIGRVCQPCQMPCSHCNQTASNCINCVTGYIFYAPNQCITQCPKGTFRNGSQCSLCHSYCLTCSGSADNCFTCKTNYLMVPSQMACVQQCPNKTFITGNTCQLCQYPCLECSSQTQCVSCITGTLVGTSCWSSCPSGYFSILNTCKACQSPCLQCQLAANQCKQCISGYYLFQNSCIVSCPAGYFGQVSSKQCLQCLGLCKQCTSIINCTTCLNNLTFYFDVSSSHGSCMNQCPTSYYPITNTQLNRAQCTNCLPQCRTCTNNIQCITCLNNKSQYLGQCVVQCPPRMYSYNGICKDCSEPCFNCTDTFTCTACMNNSFLLVGKAQCIVGQVCPQGFYRIPNTRQCNSTCPVGYYYRNDRTCNNIGCDVDEYKGADMHCYDRCPDGYISDRLLNCIKCLSSQSCQNGLFYDIEPAIIRDQLVLYLIFKQIPIYKVNSPNIQLQPYFNFQLILYKKTGEQQKNSYRSRVLVQASVQPIRNITILLYPQQSFPQKSLTIRFLSALSTFQNPIQRTYKTIMLPGYDLYPETPTISIGLLLLGCALMGMVKNPFMTDFAQLVYLMALINLHYPSNLASVLQSGKMAHLHGFVTLHQIYVTGKAKFSYITDMGLLSNSVVNLGIVVLGLVVFLIIFIIYQILKKIVQYNKIKQDPSECQQNPTQNNAMPQQPANQPQNQPEDSRTSYKIFQCMQKYFIQDFKMSYLNRLIYFNYLPLSVFTFTQLSSMYFGTDSVYDLGGSVLAIFVLIGLLVFPFIIFTGNKPKYTFLMLRKFILAIVIMLSVQNPTYMIGVSAVMSIMTAILVGAYGMEKWQVQTKFNASMQLVQTILMINFAIFAIIGEGNHTNLRLYLSWIIIFMIIAICFVYIVFSVFCFVLWSCKKFRGVDYVHIWKQEQAANLSQGDSETNSNKFSTKQEKNKIQGQKQEGSKTITLQKLLTNLQINKQSVKQVQQNGPGDKYRIKTSTSRLPINSNITHMNNNQLFWTYNDNQQPQQDTNQPKAPDMLIRCVNQFSDYDQRQKRQRRKQFQQNQSHQSSQKIKQDQNPAKDKKSNMM